MILIGYYESPFVRRVAVTMLLCGLPFEHRPYSTSADREPIRAMLCEFMGYFAAIDPGDRVTGTERGDADLARIAGLAFAPVPVCSVLIAERAGRPVAYLAYHFGVWETYAALYVVGLFVTANARKHGVGRPSRRRHSASRPFAAGSANWRGLPLSAFAVADIA